MPSSAHLAAAGRLLEAWYDLHRRSRALTAEIARTAGVSVSTMWLLAQLDRLGEARVADIAAEMFVDPSVASRQISYLEQSGFVSRRVDPNDGRAYLVRLTDAGHDVLTQVRALRQTTLSRALEDWDAEDLDALGESLRQMSERITEATAQGLVSA